jgi:transcriptional regulator with GAF, ATPase, and Fis domain
VEEDLQVLTIIASLIGHAVRLRQESTRNLHTLDDWKGLRDLERELVMRALHEASGTQARAAARLGLTPRQFAYKMKKYRIIKEFRIDG